MTSTAHEPIVLSPEQEETHTLHTSFHDTAEMQRKCQWVTRKSDGTNDGPVRWYHPNGALWHAGTSIVEPIGTWHTYREDGSLMLEEVAQGGDVWRVTAFENGKRVREGKRSRNAQGQQVFEGYWTIFTDGVPTHQERCPRGDAWGSSLNATRPMPDAMRAALLASDVSAALAALRRTLLSPNARAVLWNGADGLLDEGFTPSPEAAVALAFDPQAWGHDPEPKRALRYVLPIAKETLPLVITRAEAIPPNRPDVTHACAILLPRLLEATGAPLDARWDTLLTQAMTIAFSQPIVAFLGETLLTLPPERREALLLAMPTIDWQFARFVPTPKILGRALDDLAKRVPDARGRDSWSERVMQEALVASGPAAVAPLVAWIEGPGKQAAWRGVVLRALGAIGGASVATVLLAHADDRYELVRNAAREALRMLGEAARPALIEASKGEGTLARWARDELHAVEALPSAADVALRELQASLTSEERARYAEIAAPGRGYAGVWPEPATVQVRAAIQADPVRALAAFAELDVVHGFFGFALAEVGKHPGIAAIVADLLAADRGIYGLDETLLDRAPSALDPLGFRLERRLPGNTAKIAAHVAEHHAWEGRRVLIACARSEDAPVRELAVRGLVRAGMRVVPEVLPLLARDDDESVISAARVICALPASEAVAVLEKALAGATGERLAALTLALESCRMRALASDHAALDAYLAERARERGANVPRLPGLQAMRFRDGIGLSEDARRGLLAALAADDASAPHGGLAAIRREIDDGDAAELLTVMQRELLGHKPWRVLAIGTLGSDAQLDALGAGAQTPLEIEALWRSGRGVAFEWLDHLSAHGKPALARAAQEALRHACEERGIDRDGLFDLTMPRAPHDPEKARATLRRRLEAAMIVGRSYDAEHFRVFVIEHPVVRAFAAGLVWKDAKGRLAILTAEGAVDAAGVVVDLVAPVTIPHPIEIDEAVLAALRERLAALALVQPFAQLERRFHRDAQAQLATLITASKPRPLAAFEGLLRQRGYHRGTVEEGIVTESRRPLGDGWFMMVRHDAIWVRERGQKTCGLQNIEPIRLPVWAAPTPALWSEALEDARIVLETEMGPKKARAPKKPKDTADAGEPKARNPRKPRKDPAT
ncbi:DUF4132 domain-containing protein [Polyangium mundeleinium]|uniref:DUF4132 domain-containing protein n=1 Tax=Polyangium mundeleinium TaxID=2995306 RepID=A0ABT5F1F9_9BACT|nr:DUF4132 domain-containing protein [Polyangium mundeleinium]MDC0747920.1 DUF4132 domain-containing protein [Polyangium mundeleinium]